MFKRACNMQRLCVIPAWQLGVKVSGGSRPPASAWTALSHQHARGVLHSSVRLKAAHCCIWLEAGSTCSPSVSLRLGPGDSSPADQGFCAACQAEAGTFPESPHET